MNTSAPKIADFLVEIQTEELPPKALLRLAESFTKEITDRLTKAELSFRDYQFFATPRRLAVIVTDLLEKQADKLVERKGPSFEAAFDAQGKPTPACMGFARSCGVTPDQLITIENESGKWIGFNQSTQGKTIKELLPQFVQQALNALPIPKRMRWGSNTVEFVRPVHSVIMLYGNNVIDAEILGCKTGRMTRGHRFMCTEPLEIKTPQEYAHLLEKKGFVIADFKQRKEKIRSEAVKQNSHVVLDENLLDEVTGLVEWPVAITGHFDKKFLTVPQEALISAMQDHQRYFPVLDSQGKLQPEFIAISNMVSKNVDQVISGNERVLRARLSDAAFFFEMDRKIPLSQRKENLRSVIFQDKLGTLADKSYRLSALSKQIADLLGLDAKSAEEAGEAGLLAKTDQLTQLVSEFPELQGTAGFYYALNDNLPKDVALAIRDQYYPRFSGDKLPETGLGCVLGLSDRIDTLVGIFGINQQPTSEKDPYGLRRAALGILRILIEKKLNLDLRQLIMIAHGNYAPISLPNLNVIDEVTIFVLERLKPLAQDQGISADVFASVAALNITVPLDIYRRIQAVQAFKKMNEAESLSIANKRVSNILSQYTQQLGLKDIDEKLFDHDSEKILASKLKEQQKSLSSLSSSANYQEALTHLADLREPVDNFFDHVMVMTDDPQKRDNRILLLKKLRELFLNVADIALLQ